MKRYDYSFAAELIEKNKDELKRVYLGMQEDWEWTEECIWSNGKYRCNLNEEPSIAGIYGSNWATPTIHLSFKDGNDVSLFCYVDDGAESYMTPLNAAVYYGTKFDM